MYALAQAAAGRTKLDVPHDVGVVSGFAEVLEVWKVLKGGFAVAAVSAAVNFDDGATDCSLRFECQMIRGMNRRGRKDSGFQRRPEDL